MISKVKRLRCAFPFNNNYDVTDKAAIVFTKPYDIVFAYSKYHRTIKFQDKFNDEAQKLINLHCKPH